MNLSTLKESTELTPDQRQVNRNSLRVGGIRLNLGGRGTKIPGFQTVDLSEDHDVEIKSDVSNLWMFNDDSVDEIYASQILEHFPHVKTKSVLQEWHRVLKTGSRLTIGVPDFARAIELYQQGGMTDWIMNFLYGDQTYPLAYHYRPFTFGILAALLSDMGFRNIKRLTKMPYGIVDCSSLICNFDQKNVSLNVEAYK